MPGSSIGITMNIGYPGSFARNADCIILNRGVLATDLVNVAFGDPVVLNSDNTVSKFGASNTAAQFAGVAIREVKQAQDYYTPAGYYKPGTQADILTRGGICVQVQNGTPTAAGGAVYLRTVAGSLATPVGGFEAAAASDGGTTILLNNVVFATGNIDANNIAEITILTRHA
jgi:hypothetical protein